MRIRPFLILPGSFVLAMHLSLGTSANQSLFPPSPCAPSLQTTALGSASQYVYFLIGAPNAGKGTSGRPLAELLQIPYVSTGDMIRAVIASGSELGLRIAPIVNGGGMIDTRDVMPLLEDWVRKQNPRRGFILDGSPRKLLEAQLLEREVKAQGFRGIRVIYFQVSETTIHQRARGRWNCSSKSCGQTYHKDLRPPQTPRVCDRCRSPLFQRPDDVSPESVARRLQLFREESLPVVDYFRSQGLVMEINGEGEASVIFSQLLSEILKLP